MNAPSADSNGRTVASLFCGRGGSSLGYKWAGFREVLACDWDKDAIECFRLNFPEVPTFHGDVKQLTAAKFTALSGIQPGELDVLDSSPPCQGFSTAGKRRLTDPRNSLAWEVIRLLRELQPRAFVLENVSGLVKGHMKGVYLTIINELRACGYDAKGAVLDAQFFGVPQERKRVIIVGVRADLRVGASHPPPAGRPIPVAQALPGTLATRSMAINKWIPGARAAATVCASGGDYSIVREYHSERVIEAWHASRPGQSLQKARRYVGSFQSVRLDPRKPSPTQIAAHLNWHWSEPRQLTIPESATLQSFPADFQWPSNKGIAQRLIGNAVPPKLMEAIARHVAGLLQSAK